MNKLILIALTIVVCVFGAKSTLAQQKVTPEKEALIKELLSVSGATKQVRDAANLMASFQRTEAERSISDLADDLKTLSPEEKDALKKSTTESVGRITKRFDEFFNKELDLDTMLQEVVVPVYDKHFSESELRDLIAFYKSPTGQKMITAMPQLTADVMTGFLEKIGPKLRDFVKRVTDEETELVKKNLDSKTTPSKSGPQ